MLSKIKAKKKIGVAIIILTLFLCLIPTFSNNAYADPGYIGQNHTCSAGIEIWGHEIIKIEWTIIQCVPGNGSCTPETCIPT